MTPIHINYPVSIAILYFKGTTGDLEDTISAVSGIRQALENQGHIVRVVEVTSKNWQKMVKVSGDVVFNLVEDPTWELYLKVGKRLEEMGRAQVAHDYRSFSYAIKKARVKRKLHRFGLATPSFRILTRRHKPNLRGLEYPLIVKPSGQHAGIGISQDSVVIDVVELQDRVKYLFKHFPGEVVVEKFIDGREIHVTVMGNDRHVFALPTCEVEFEGEFADNWDVYTYQAKWEKSSWEYWSTRSVSPARLSKKLTIKIEKLAIKTYKALGCRDIARIDMRVDNRNRFYIIDVNMNPSLNAYEDEGATLRSMEALDWSYEELIETLVAITYKRVYGHLPDRVRARQLLLTGFVK